MPFGARGVRPESVRVTLPARYVGSPMPFGARGVRPWVVGAMIAVAFAAVSNAFRREGRSPRNLRYNY